MVNVRVKDGTLNDVCAYIYGDKAKQIFDKLLKDKGEIEKEIGYQLVWDRNENKKSTRISRFGQYSTDPNQYGLCNDENVLVGDLVKPFDFNLDKEKVAKALVDFYKVFVPRVIKLFDEF